jgi:hypothetical protein
VSDETLSKIFWGLITLIAICNVVDVSLTIVDRKLGKVKNDIVCAQAAEGASK